MATTLYQTYLKRAVTMYGSIEAVEDKLPSALSAKQLQDIGDDRYLAEMAACIFRAGFVWRVVKAKWPGFEEVFNGFMPLWLASRSAEDIEKMASNPLIIRNLTKVRAVQENARHILDIQHSHGSFGNFISGWPEDDISGLWLALKKHGCRLGGMSGQYFLRFIGKDTFVLSRDVCVALIAEGIIGKTTVTAQRDVKIVQQCFNDMRAESGRPLCELSMILALSVGPH